MNPEPTRRVFIKRTTESAALLAGASTLGAVHGFAADPPATIRLGLIGCGGIMGHHTKGLVSRREAVSIAWLCDVDPGQIEKAARLIDGFQSAPPKRTARFEDVLLTAWCLQRLLGPKAKTGPTEGDALHGQTGYPEHMANFLEAVRNRTPTRAAPQIAHRSCALVHLGEIAYRTRGRLDFDPETGRFPDCEQANRLLGKAYREPYGLPDLS